MEINRKHVMTPKQELAHAFYLAWTSSSVKSFNLATDEITRLSKVVPPEEIFECKLDAHKILKMCDSIVQDKMSDSTTFCCYCGIEQGERWHCCGENHFERFSEMYEDSQNEIVEMELEDLIRHEGIA